MNKPLRNKIALVTGASRGIGAAIATQLARDGADVAISYLSSTQQAAAVVNTLQAQGVRAMAIQADAADQTEIAALIKKVVEHFGGLDILVNNAGISFAAQGVDVAHDSITIERGFQINVHAVATAVRTAIPFISDQGRIINIGSGLGERSVWPGIGDYSATKAAVNLYSRSWARELAPRGITVNTVQPGPIVTDMNPDTGDIAEMAKRLIPMGRYGRPEEIAATVAFLASPAASFISGAALNVDGAMSA